MQVALTDAVLDMLTPDGAARLEAAIAAAPNAYAWDLDPKQGRAIGRGAELRPGHYDPVEVCHVLSLKGGFARTDLTDREKSLVLLHQDTCPEAGRFERRPAQLVVDTTQGWLDGAPDDDEPLFDVIAAECRDSASEWWDDGRTVPTADLADDGEELPF